MEKTLQVLDFILRSIVTKPEEIQIETARDVVSFKNYDNGEVTEKEATVIHITVATEDTGKVLGGGGAMAKAIRRFIRDYAYFECGDPDVMAYVKADQKRNGFYFNKPKQS